MSGNDSARSFLDSLVNYTADAQGGDAGKGQQVKLGVVDPAYTGGAARVKFDGESIMGTRTYVALQSVAANDRVVLLPVGRTYAILGSVAGEVAPAWADLTGVPATFPPSAHTLASHTGEIANTQLPGRLQEGSSYGGGDANTFVTNGWYKGNSIANAPTAGWYYFKAIAHNTDWVYQKAIMLSNNESYERWNRNGVWTQWFKVITFDNATEHKGIPFAMAAGAVSIASAASNGGSSTSVTFPSGRFSVAPIVTVTIGGSTRFNIGTSSVTASGFTVRVDNFTSGTALASTAQWEAVQMTSGAAAG